jgi:hypothetical protein
MSAAAMMRNTIIGAVLWSALVAASVVGWLHWGVIEFLFLLGPLVVVPLGLELACRLVFPYRTGDAWMQLSAALCVAASFLLPQGSVAALLVLPWLAFAVVLALRVVVRLFNRDGRDLQSVCLTASACYLPIGCAWLVASRYGLSPMGFQEPIVLLTAVHFHFAGFAAPLLAMATANTLGKASAPALTFFKVVAAGVLLGPGLLAAGFIIGPRVKLAAALLIAVSEFGLAAFFLAAARTLRPRMAQILVTLSAASVMAAMVLAAVWAVGEFPLQPFVHLDEMARLHGTANAVGFAGCGLLGWTMAVERSKEHVAA